MSKAKTKTLNQPMNATQIKHAAARLDEIKKLKIEAIERPGNFSMTEMQVAAIKAGKARLAVGKLKDITRYTDVHEVFEYPTLPTEDEARAEHEAKVGKVNQKIQAIHAEAARLKDLLILGDASEAMKMLKAFEAKKF